MVKRFCGLMLIPQKFDRYNFVVTLILIKFYFILFKILFYIKCFYSIK